MKLSQPSSDPSSASSPGQSPSNAPPGASGVPPGLFDDRAHPVSRDDGAVGITLDDIGINDLLRGDNDGAAGIDALSVNTQAAPTLGVAVGVASLCVQYAHVGDDGLNRPDFAAAERVIDDLDVGIVFQHVGADLAPDGKIRDAHLAGQQRLSDPEWEYSSKTGYFPMALARLSQYARLTS